MTTTLPKYKIGDKIQVGSSRYSFRVDEIIFEGPGMWRYRGQMFKDNRTYFYGTVTECAVDGY